MSRMTYFVQECPTCGRGLEVKVEYLGKKVACQHCRGTFVARDPSNQMAVSEDTLELLRRADELLEMTSAEHAW